MAQRHDGLPSDGLDGPGRASGRTGWLLATAAGETLTLAGLLVNLVLTTHSDALAAVLGPVHGAFYLAALLLTWSGGLPRAVKLAAVVPVAGAWLASAAARRASSGTPRRALVPRTPAGRPTR